MRAVFHLIDNILWLYTWAIILVALMSWLISFNVVNFHNQMVRSVWNGLNAIVEPALQPIRRFLPNMGGIDISPVILLLIVSFLRDFIREMSLSLVSGF
jgi:YggT family protein